MLHKLVVICSALWLSDNYTPVPTHLLPLWLTCTGQKWWVMTHRSEKSAHSCFLLSQNWFLLDISNNWGSQRAAFCLKSLTDVCRTLYSEVMATGHIKPCRLGHLGSWVLVLTWRPTSTSHSAEAVFKTLSRRCVHFSCKNECTMDWSALLLTSQQMLLQRAPGGRCVCIHQM